MAYHQYSAWSHNYAYEHDGGNDILVTDHNHICVKFKISRIVYFQQNWNKSPQNSLTFNPFSNFEQVLLSTNGRFTHAYYTMFTFYVRCIK